jgi:tripartite-type tricarboxylate transporter receptor subunit TctC
LRPVRLLSALLVAFALVSSAVAAGSLPHFFGVMLDEVAWIEMVHVPYNGAGALANDLVGGRLEVGIDALSDLVAPQCAGSIRVLATSGAQRSPLLPTGATFKEQGFASLEGGGWVGLYAPARTPQATLDYLSAAVVPVLHAPELKDKLANLGLEAAGTTSQALAAIRQRDVARWKPVVEASGFTAD